MTRLCTYIVTEDSGFAPNPFWRRCTLAHCTPNHMSARLTKGDWIAGFLSKSRQNRFLFAMEVHSVIPLGDYFADPRFVSKKPKPSLNYKDRCGDNIYELQNGHWLQHPNDFHNTKFHKDKDTRLPCPKVFVASKFWYLGRKAHQAPARFAPLIPDRWGIRCNHDPRLTTEFMRWVTRTQRRGVHAHPNCIRPAQQYVQITRESRSIAFATFGAEMAFAPKRNRNEHL